MLLFSSQNLFARGTTTHFFSHALTTTQSLGSIHFFFNISLTDLCEGGNRGLSSGGGSRRGLMEGSSWGGRARGCRRGGGGHTGGRLLLLLEGILVALWAEPVSVGGPKEAAASAAQDGPGLKLVALSLHPPVDLMGSQNSVLHYWHKHSTPCLHLLTHLILSFVPFLLKLVNVKKGR